MGTVQIQDIGTQKNNKTGINQRKVERSVALFKKSYEDIIGHNSFVHLLW